MSKKIKVNDLSIAIINKNENDYISLTDMVKNTPNNHIVIGNWLRKKDTIEYLGLWEQLNNPNFKLIDFDEFMKNAGSNRFTLSPQQWISKTNSIGLISKSGRNGGSYAHKDIAFNFAMWISPAFQLLIIKEFQRLKEQESKFLGGEWDYRRFLTKVNYRLHTDAIKDNIIPTYSYIKKGQESNIYANEAEILNVAVFGETSKHWRERNVQMTLDGYNIRDIANVLQLTVLANLESINALLIKEGMSPDKRLEKLKQQAVSQLQSLSNIKYTHSIESPHLQQYEQTSTFNQNLKKALNHNPKEEK